MKKKQLESHINEIFTRIGYGIQINIMDLSKIFNAGRKAYIESDDIENAMKEAINKYGVKS